VAESKSKAASKAEADQAYVDEPAASDKFSRERLLDESLAITGHPRHVVAGALADKGGDNPLTADQAKSAVEKFLNRDVKTDEPDKEA